MKKICWYGVILVFLICGAAIGTLNAQSIIPPGFKQIGLINFNNWAAGNWYTLDMMTNDWNPRLKNGDETIDFKGIIHNRAFVVKHEVFKGNARRVFLPRGKFSPAQTGAQIFGYIGGREEVYFGVSVYLPPSFECGREIKLPPGIYGGWKFATGGVRPDGEKIGPSIRAVLHQCQAKSYVYHLNQSGDNGDGGGYRNPKYGDKFAWKYPNGLPVVMAKGVKHDILFYVAMNMPGKRDGVHKVWYDGVLVLSLDDLEFRLDSSLKFDTVGSEVFLGGNNQSYAVTSDNTLDLSDFKVYAREK